MVIRLLLSAVGVPLNVTGIELEPTATGEVVVTVRPAGTLNQLEMSVPAGMAVLIVVVIEIVAVFGAKPTLVQPLMVMSEIIAVCGPE